MNEYDGTLFYQEFVGPGSGKHSLALTPKRVLKEAVKRSRAVGREQRKELVAGLRRRPMLRVAVNSASRDIRTLFAYISDREDLLKLPSEESRAPDFGRIGPRSPLFRLNGNPPDKGDPSRNSALPISWIVLHCIWKAAPAGDRVDSHRLDFRLLALSEKALLSSYLSYRDCIPDFGYAHTAVVVAELYIIALEKLGRFAFQVLEAPHTRIGEAARRLTNLAKRFAMKAIDILRREREQNRNTFHLTSEAYFNLGDLLLIRLGLLQESRECFRLFPEWVKVEASGSGSSGGDPLTMGLGDEVDGDFSAEDVRRQVWDAYRNGLVLVQNEIEEYQGRFRFPQEVFHAHRNIMDAVLHFRICKAARLRHSAAMPGADPKLVSWDASGFRENWEALCRQVAEYEFPQHPNDTWLRALSPLLTEVNKVRTDRGPLAIRLSADGKRVRVEWVRSLLTSFSVDGVRKPKRLLKLLFPASTLDPKQGAGVGESTAGSVSRTLRAFIRKELKDTQDRAGRPKAERRTCSSEFETDILETLNRIVADPTPWDAARLRGIDLSPETKRLSARVKRIGGSQARLKRLILEDALDNVLTRSQEHSGWNRGGVRLFHPRSIPHEAPKNGPESEDTPVDDS